MNVLRAHSEDRFVLLCWAAHGPTIKPRTEDMLAVQLCCFGRLCANQDLYIEKSCSGETLPSNQRSRFCSECVRVKQSFENSCKHNRVERVMADLKRDDFPAWLSLLRSYRDHLDARLQ